MKCRITEKICTAWSEVAGCGLVRCKFMEKKDGAKMSDKQDLKPCPFCGKKVKILKSRKQGVPSGDNGWYARISCECGAEMRFWALKQSWAEETVTKAWNHRYGEDGEREIDYVPVVRCIDCVLEGNCFAESHFNFAGIQSPFCCAGKRKEGSDNA